MSKIGYIRVSSVGQETARQNQLMKDLGVEKVFSEKLSGKTADRPELQNMLKYIREDDVLYVESISRLSRSIRDLLKIVDTLNSKGVKLVSCKEALDTGTPQGRFRYSPPLPNWSANRHCSGKKRASKLLRRLACTRENNFDELMINSFSNCTASGLTKKLQPPNLDGVRGLHQVHYTGVSTIIKKQEKLINTTDSRRKFGIHFLFAKMSIKCVLITALIQQILLKRTPLEANAVLNAH
ncbi:MAG: recombinase family protein [Muribaculaceae bacterium]|nr:recombinase family protein [Muribaculaceae bacterium]MCM1479293.1 recombinase family protein [Muribaculaceae bacterium]